jgi:hypothetical protein
VDVAEGNDKENSEREQTEADNFVGNVMLELVPRRFLFDKEDFLPGYIFVETFQSLELKLDPVQILSLSYIALVRHLRAFLHKIFYIYP